MTFFLTKQYTRLAFTLNVDRFPDPQDLHASDNWVTGDPLPWFKPLEAASSFLIYAMEVADSGQKHYQGYVEFNKKKLGTVIKALLPGAHFEGAVGTAKQNITYCSKACDMNVNPPFISGEVTKVGRQRMLRDMLLLYPVVPEYNGAQAWGPWQLIRVDMN